MKTTPMSMLASAFLAAAALLLSLSTTFAQSGRQVAFRTLCLDVSGDPPQLSLPSKDPGESQKISLYSDLSPVIEGSFQTGDAQFFTETTGVDGKPIRKLVAKAPLAKSTRQLFLFVATGETAEGKLPYVLYCYDDDTKTFPMGQVRVVNLSPVAVRFQLSGEMTPQVPPSRYAQFPHSTKVDSYNMYPVVIQFLSANNKWVNGQSVSWKTTNRRREIVVTMIDPKFKQPAVRMYSDVPPWLEPAKDSQ